MNKSLDFAVLRQANMARLPLFKNAKGEPAHSRPDGSDWPLSQWMNAVLGELGEAANIIKKIERGDFTLEQGRHLLGRELADVQTYLDIISFRAGIDLGIFTMTKWNEKSAQVNCPLRLIFGSGGAFLCNIESSKSIGHQEKHGYDPVKK